MLSLGVFDPAIMLLFQPLLTIVQSNIYHLLSQCLLLLVPNAAINIHDVTDDISQSVNQI